MHREVDSAFTWNLQIGVCKPGFLVDTSVLSLQHSQGILFCLRTQLSLLLESHSYGFGPVTFTQQDRDRSQQTIYTWAFSLMSREVSHEGCRLFCAS